MALLGVLAEAAAVVAAAGLLVTDVVTGQAHQVGSTLAIAVFLVGIAALLVGSARALAHGRRWARGPVLTWQLIQAASGATQLSTSPVVGALLLGVALVVVVGLLAPASIAATARTSADAEPGQDVA